MNWKYIGDYNGKRVFYDPLKGLAIEMDFEYLVEPGDDEKAAIYEKFANLKLEG